MSSPILTANNGHDEIDNGLIVNGQINIRKTHPNLYRQEMLLGFGFVFLAANFFVFTPTFQVYHLPNTVWGSIFLVLGLAKLGFLNFYRRLGAVRVTMAFAVSFLAFFSIGTGEPWLDGQGSLQLPILYMGLAGIQLPMLLEPFIQPWTARRE